MKMLNNHSVSQQMADNSDSSFLEEISYKYLPYWPLFILFLIIFIGAAFAYLSYVNPKYSISATMMINDEKKGAEETKIEESINLLSSNKAVDNEVEVLQSRKIMSTV